MWVGFHKKGGGKAGITCLESVDAALCVGWIDGVRKSLGAESLVIRFTPRTTHEHLERGERQSGLGVDCERKNAVRRANSVWRAVA